MSPISKQQLFLHSSNPNIVIITNIETIANTVTIVTVLEARLLEYDAHVFDK